MPLKGQPFKKIGGILKQVAPTILAGFGGPVGGIVASTIKRGLGQPDASDTALEDLIAAATGSTEGLAKLREIEAELKKIEAENGFKFAEIAANDRASARDLAKSTTLWPQIVLAALYTSAYVAVLFMYLTGAVHVEPVHQPMIQTLIGALSAVQVQVLNFFFGSSAGSKEKTLAMAKVSK